MQSRPAPAARALMWDVLYLCMKITDTTKADCFFEYAPHVNSYHVYFCRDGWSEDAEFEYVAQCADITVENLEATYAKLKKIYDELKEKKDV